MYAYLLQIHKHVLCTIAIIIIFKAAYCELFFTRGSFVTSSLFPCPKGSADMPIQRYSNMAISAGSSSMKHRKQSGKQRALKQFLVEFDFCAENYNSRHLLTCRQSSGVAHTKSCDFIVYRLDHCILYCCRWKTLDLLLQALLQLLGIQILQQEATSLSCIHHLTLGRLSKCSLRVNTNPPVQVESKPETLING